MKLTATQLRKIIREEASKALKVNKKYSLLSLLEDASPTKIDPKLFPTSLSQVDPSIAKALASKGQEDDVADDDVASGGQTSSPANSLRATQTTMDFGKFVGMAIQMMGKMGNFSGGAGGDLGAIVSNDNHIMDGHHRWAATLMVDPSASVGGLQIDLPGKELVGVLNVWTAAHGGQGKPSDANLDALTPEAVADKFVEMASKGGKFLPAPEEILKAFQANGFETLEDAAEHVKENWAATADTRAVEGWMPPKVDMPAIEPSQLAAVKKDIESGTMDINPPYSPEIATTAGDAGKTKKESRFRNEGAVIVERWQKLAGLIK